MGIYDREYVRIGPHSKSGLGSLRFVSFNSWLIIVNVAVFLVQGLLLTGAGVPVAVEVVGDPQPSHVAEPLLDARRAQVATPESQRRVGNVLVRRVFDPATGAQTAQITYSVMDPLAAYGHFSTERGFLRLEVWRLVTFQFLHGGFSHLFFNMFGLWIFGGMVEEYLGRKRYAAFYLVCGIFGGLTYLLLNVLGGFASLRLPGVLFNDPRIPLVGASAGVFGVIVACAYIAPNAIIQLIFPPVPLRMRTMAYGYVAIAAFNLLRGGHNAGGDAAHVGGAVAGFFFIRNAHLLLDFFDVTRDSRKAKGRRPREPDRAELDRILVKISAQGLHSLTEPEKRTLRKASEDAGRR